MGFAGGIIFLILIFVFLFFLLLPVIVALIYSTFYNRHANEMLRGGSGKKWISPFLLGFILFVVEFSIFILIIIGGFVAYKVGPSEHYSEMWESDYASGVYCETYTPDETEGTHYAIFDGGEVVGYSREKLSEGDFEYVIYKNSFEDDYMLPEYVIVIDYSGAEKAGFAYGHGIFSDHYEEYGIGTYADGSERYIAVLSPGYYNTAVSYSITLMEGDLSAMDDFDPDTAEGLAELEIALAGQ